MACKNRLWINLILKTSESVGIFLVKVWNDQEESQNIWAFNRNSKLEKWLTDKRQIPPNSRFWFECHSYALKWPDWKSCVISVNTRVQSPHTGCYKRDLNSMPFAVVPFFIAPPPQWPLLKLWLCEVEWNETFQGKVLEAAWAVTEDHVLSALQLKG